MASNKIERFAWIDINFLEVLLGYTFFPLGIVPEAYPSAFKSPNVGQLKPAMYKGGNTQGLRK